MTSLVALRSLEHLLKRQSANKIYRNLLKCNQNLVSLTKTLATKTHNSPNPATYNNGEWRIIYQLPLVSFASAFSHLKVPYGILNGIIVPASFALEEYSQLPPSTALIISAVGLTSWCTLAIFSFFIRNLIGIIYINDNNDKLKLAYVNYWGKRCDVCIDLNDIKSESESPKVDFYQSICLYSDKKAKYKLLQRFGKIEDPKTFASVFGE